MNASYLDPIEASYSTWHNPLDVPQTVDIYEADHARPTRYRIPPGESVRIPSVYDRAIQRRHQGTIVGGLAPLLRKVGEDHRLDPALDPEASARMEAMARAKLALQHKAAAEAALIAASAQLVAEPKGDDRKPSEPPPRASVDDAKRDEEPRREPAARRGASGVSGS